MEIYVGNRARAACFLVFIFNSSTLENPTREEFSFVCKLRERLMLSWFISRIASWFTLELKTVNEVISAASEDGLKLRSGWLALTEFFRGS